MWIMSSSKGTDWMSALLTFLESGKARRISRTVRKIGACCVLSHWSATLAGKEERGYVPTANHASIKFQLESCPERAPGGRCQKTMKHKCS